MQSIRKYSLLLAMVFCALAVNAQTFSEWFRQKSTQQKYLLEQVAALKAYATLVGKGYKLVNNGLRSIEQFKDGELGLHQLFFDGLNSVSPIVSSDKGWTAIIAMELKTLENLKEAVQLEGLSDWERAYLLQVRRDLTAEIENESQEILSIGKSGKLEMTDAERLERLKTVYNNSLDRLTFSNGLLKNTVLALQDSARGKNELKRVGGYYE